MKCPNCSEQAISFYKWIQGTNAFKTNCSNCGAPIKANILVYILFISTLLITLSLIPYLDELFSLFEIEVTSKKVKLLALIPVMFAGGFAAWFIGGYRTNESA